MAQSLLVDRDLYGGAQLIDALAAARIPIQHAFWSTEDGESSTWILHVVTPLYDEIGPLRTLDRIDAALHDQRVPRDIRSSLQVLGPDGLSASVKQQLSTMDRTAISAVSGSRNPSIVPYVGGSVRIDMEAPPSNRFRVSFVPYGGAPVADSSVTGTINLTRLLMETLNVDSLVASEAVVRAAMTGHWSIPNVVLTEEQQEQFRTLGLAA